MADVTMPNGGLLNGLAEGLKQGMITYQNMKNIQQQRQMQMLMSGIQQNPDTGAMEYTPQKLAQINAQTIAANRQADELNGESDLSKGLATSRGILAHAGNPNIPENVFEGKSAADQKELEGLTKPDVTGNYGLMGRQVLANLMGQRLQQGNARIQMSANKDYSHEMGNTENQLLQANRANEIASRIQAGDLQGTTQLKSDLSASIAQMMNGGKPATVYGMSHQEFDSAWGRLQHAYGFLSGQTPGTLTDAQLVQLRKDLGALSSEYQKQREIKYNSFKEGMPGQVVQGLDNRYQSFGNSSGATNPGLIQGGNTHPQDAQAIEWAKAHSDDPRAAKILKANGL